MDQKNSKKYKLDSRIKQLSADHEKYFYQFWQEVDTIEGQQKANPIIFQDLKSGAFYVECHILASVAEPLLDLDSVLDPEEQAEYRANRSTQAEHRAFVQMINDANKGRQFSDLIVEFNKEYRSQKPLKVLGGQHRVLAMREALQKKIDRPHGFKVYFG